MPRPKSTIAYVTGTRADFGLMTPVLQDISRQHDFRLRLYATGMHLLPQFGHSLKEVRRVFPTVQTISASIPTDRQDGLARFFADLSLKVAPVFRRDRPHMVLVLGDRAEMLAVSSICAYLGIPVAHIHGGDLSGTVDETVRHAITKLAALHLAATTSAVSRLCQMGEEAWRVHRVGAPALDVIRTQKLPSGSAVRKHFSLPSNEPLTVITLHPISDDWRHAGQQMDIVMKAALTCPGHIVVGYPNADAGGRKMIEVIERYRRHPRVDIYQNLQYNLFLALEREATVWVGNSSAGMIESGAWPTPVVNVGPRQRGREHGNNVINAPYNTRSIVQAIRRATTNRAWRQRMKQSSNPWGDGHAAGRIVQIIRKYIDDPRLLTKRFVEIGSHRHPRRPKK